MKVRPVKIGLIGCGKVALGRHLPALASLPEAHVMALADIDEARLAQVAKAYTIDRPFVDYEEMLKDPSVEAVGICVPLPLHFATAMAALDAGKHVLLEKPVAMSLAEADRLIERAGTADRKIMVGFNNRWHRHVRKARDLIRQGALGPVCMITSVHSTGHHGRFLPEWRRTRATGGGNLIENGSHFFDLWRFLLGIEIETITAVSSTTAGNDDEPSAVTAQTNDGVFLNCVLSDLLPDRNEIEIFGQDCVLRVSLHRFDGLECLPLYGNVGDARYRLKNILNFFREIPRGAVQYRYGGDYNASFRAEWRHFIDCIRRDKPVECTLTDGREALKAALAAVQSASTGRPVEVAGLSSVRP